MGETVELPPFDQTLQLLEVEFDHHQGIVVVDVHRRSIKGMVDTTQDKVVRIGVEMLCGEIGIVADIAEFDPIQDEERFFAPGELLLGFPQRSTPLLQCGEVGGVSVAMRADVAVIGHGKHVHSPYDGAGAEQGDRVMAIVREVGVNVTIYSHGSLFPTDPSDTTRTPWACVHG